MSIFVRPRVVSELAGISYHSVLRDLKRFKWPMKNLAPRKLNYIDLDAVMKTYRRKFSAEQIKEAISRHNIPAGFVSE